MTKKAPAKNVLAKHLITYVVIMGISLSLILYFLMSLPQQVVEIPPASSGSTNIWLNTVFELKRNFSLPITELLIQVVVILVVARICSALLKPLGQPAVIGEMVAGIVLGKSVLALLWPDFHLHLFPETSYQRLHFLSQLGLILFMFVVGLEFDAKNIKNKASSAVLVSHVSIAFPFLLGVILSRLLYIDYAPQGVPFISFALFMGISMSITAFPVLARILQEHNLTKTSLGTLAITCAAADDVTAWSILAIVIGITQGGNGMGAIAIILMSLIYFAAMIKIVAPILARILKSKDGVLTGSQYSILFLTLFASALTTEIIGIHALFGAFIAGIVVPRNEILQNQVIIRIKDLSSIVLLPIFFALTGLRTQINLLEGAQMWLICGLIICVAITGKVLGTAVSAKVTGVNWKDSFLLGVLMNTRGLMELIVLNIGYDLGILSPTIFTMLVVMAIFTTMMAGPLIYLLVPERKAAPANTKAL